MQHHAVMESPHFWIGSVVLILLAINSVISLIGFRGNNKGWRNVHAYLGSTALCLLFLHALLGLKLGLVI